MSIALIPGRYTWASIRQVSIPSPKISVLYYVLYKITTKALVVLAPGETNSNAPMSQVVPDLATPTTSVVGTSGSDEGPTPAPRRFDVALRRKSLVVAQLASLNSAPQSVIVTALVPVPSSDAQFVTVIVPSKSRPSE